MNYQEIKNKCIPSPLLGTSFLEDIADLMRQVAPPDLWKKANGMSKQNKKTFYEMVCHHACLDKDSWTVKNAFDKATNDLKGEQNGKN